ncbi:Bcr/CflA family multidrug efflux MFS transporter [Streptomyces sp. NPDC097619]|uniref:Bcr/CflA family multidrug efflux MFS transporter n=1 Tax=Streptomyces sp. NPDC097619 TaxID=3157228 RepID=UPI00331D6CA4
MPDRGRATDPPSAIPVPAMPGSPGPVPAVPGPAAPVSPVPGPPAVGAAPPAVRRAGLLIVLVLGGLSALPPLSMDMYLPALPEVTGALAAPAATVQLTLTACLAGMAVGQLVIGPMSDRWGRRRPLLIGMVAYVLATALCAVAPDAASLIFFRLLQGLAGAASIVIARAVVRDLYEGLEMARFFASLTLVSGAAPIVAPLVGGQVLRIADWRGVFWVLTGVGVLLTLTAWRCLAETLPPERRRPGGVGAALRTMRGLLADRVFTGYVLCGGLAFAVLFSYISASPFVVQEIHGASPQQFSLLFGLNSVGLIVVGQVNGKLLVGRVGLDRVLAVGLAVITLASGYLLAVTTGLFGRAGLVEVSAGLFVLMAAMGLVLPNTNAQALMRTPHAAGSASALLGTCSFLIGSVATPLVGVAGERTAVPMALVQTVCALLAVACFLGLCRPGRAGTGPAEDRKLSG